MDKELYRYKVIRNLDGILEVDKLPQGNYDEQAVKYDKLISNALYNRLMWGNSPKNYSDFCRKGVSKHTKGILADIGCGTLSFSADIYKEYNHLNIFLCDLSNAMLKIGETRLKPYSDTIKFLRSDALNMPFSDNVLTTILSFGIFHIFHEPSSLISEFSRLLKPGGQLFLSSLCTDRKFSAWYLDLLYKKGHVAQRLSSKEILDIVTQNGFKIEESYVQGGMVYITALKIPS